MKSRRVTVGVEICESSGTGTLDSTEFSAVLESIRDNAEGREGRPRGVVSPVSVERDDTEVVRSTTSLGADRMEVWDSDAGICVRSCSSASVECTAEVGKMKASSE